MKKILMKTNAVARKGMIYAIIIMGVLSFPNLGYAQPVDPGGNPDGNPPLAVPIDGRLNAILIGLGVILAVIAYKKLKNRTAVKSI
jgi:hypothetical protein